MFCEAVTIVLMLQLRYEPHKRIINNRIKPFRYTQLSPFVCPLTRVLKVQFLLTSGFVLRVNSLNVDESGTSTLWFSLI